MAVSNKDLHDRIQAAFRHPFLRKAVRSATNTLRDRKAVVAHDLGHWQEWRAIGQQIRDHVVDNLDVYLKRFAANMARQGAQVHWASTGDDALKIFLNIVDAHGAKLVLKSKSMVSEELHVNHVLEERGIRAVESDLGEYIIQLAGETPSHIIVPAIHKTRGEVAELFEQDSGEKQSPETASLTRYARHKMRQMFFDASIGVSGCNFAVADPGAISLFTNEGNGRLVTTTPPVHVVFMGMERIVPTFQELDVMAKLLPRSATGQKITSYMSVIRGPAATDESDGPKEMHIIIVDNGRSRILANPKYREVLRCIRCGSCLNVCPVYRQVGGHTYGWVYSGPIGAVLTPLLQNELKDWGETVNLTTLCGACTEACPVRIPLHEMLIQLRLERTSQGYTPALEKTAFRLWSETWDKPTLYGLMMRAAAVGQFPFMKDGHLEGGPTPLSAWTNSRYFPPVAGRTFRQRWKRGEV
ncbi:iron-sulfur cluster-binding protein [Heliobacterium gestii]|uniref:Iron-sulfur cluster-binding protein n=1 Tax=Heliomicrobium gestii TaxID=2699 RepID=A0A845LIR9_HELGE|nr:LutB/LldF family L-lactate oxidation iron-sulfur protein [Heliomicrobium gestii]MBM7867855.1 L-lactate dehydrogenase complex protein LldF [Heliomicrobium gestii]MZP43333.1 iron-sulfur cluster-binding protein [Heliomicrobium gestii]